MSQHDLVVIGAGPGGYVAAIRAAQLGLNVACIEKEKALGGTCLRVGCIPSKALLETSEKYRAAETEFAGFGIKTGKLELDLEKMQAHRKNVVQMLVGGIDGLFRKNKIKRYMGHAKFTGPNSLEVTNDKETVQVEGKNILIATGSVPSSLPGIEFNGDKIASSTEALEYTDVPQHLVVIGAGYIGVELGTVWNRLGSKVTVLEYLDRICPGTDAEIAAEAQKVFEKQGLTFQLGAKVTAASANKKGCVVEVDGQDPINCDRVLMAVGRKPNTENLGLDTIGVELAQRGFIPVDGSYATSVPNVFAVGDVIGGAMLAHKAEEEGIACVEKIVTGYGHVNYNAIPSIAYTSPEIAAVGKTEDQLLQDGVAYRKGSFPFLANGRARAIGHTEGRVKILADNTTDRLLGVHILGPHAGDLIAEAAVAMEFGASAEDLARCCHAHPTLAEAVKEAAMAVDGRAIHF
ncbi:Dihydrolipoyl dehydrogenase [Polystyrenella longa]|uniref:Dihydrolipoyl dehydrogenase n=1 Tax=Polystyrenella longa TaxID=2528007 RepID=A0A518CNZ3_9PLAN|nr:dihydrolipoyl dehydrogenase [Polystyrenella longa]QDU80933.1 Dihydrolipoyl dehydrogenase [Polystyrenella longa]